MKRMIFLMLLIAGVAFGQAHSFLSERQIMNYKDNWNGSVSDSFHVKPDSTYSLVFSGDWAGYNTIIKADTGKVWFKQYTLWDSWFPISEGESLTLTGCQIDTLFFMTNETDSAIVHILYSRWKK